MDPLDPNHDPEANAIAALQSTLDAWVEITLTPPPPRPPRLVPSYLALRDSITSCTLCPLSSHPANTSGPQPLYWSHRSKFAIVADYPFRSLPAALPNSLLDPDISNAAILYVNACTPHPITSPPLVLQRACAPNLTAQLDFLHLAGCRYLLLVGPNALRSWRSDLSLSPHAGIIGLHTSRFMVMAIPAPVPCAHSRFHSTNAILTPALDRFADLIRIGMYHPFLPVRCAFCPSYLASYDSDAVGYCQRCWDAKQGKQSSPTKRKRKPRSKSVGLTSDPQFPMEGMPQ